MFVTKQVVIFSLLTAVKDFPLPDFRLQVTLAQGFRWPVEQVTSQANQVTRSVLSSNFKEPIFPPVCQARLV